MQNKYKLRTRIKLDTFIPLAILIIGLLFLIVTNIGSQSQIVKNLFGMVFPFIFFMIYLFPAYGYAIYIALIDEGEMPRLIRRYSDAGVIVTGLFTAGAIISSYVFCTDLVRESLLAYYNIIVFFIACAQILFAGFGLARCNKALKEKADFDASYEHAKSAVKYKYLYVASCVLLILITFLFR